MKKLSLITGLLFSCLMHSQNPTFQWVKSIGGATSENEIHSTIDVFGNIYITGSFQGTVDFDPGSGISNLTAAGNKDIFIQKISASGQLMWAKRIGGSSEDVATSIAADYFGDIVITGNFKGIVDFNPNAGLTYLTSTGSSDIFIQKLNSDGELKWAKSIGGTTADYGGSIKTDEMGNIYLVHSFTGTADFDPGRFMTYLTSNGDLDICVQKLDLSGNYIWAKSFGGSLSDLGKSIAVDNSGNVYVTGYYHGTVDFDPGNGVNTVISNGGSDVFVQKLNSTGNLEWIKSMGSTGTDEGTSVSIDLSGNVYSTGTFEGTINYFDSETGSATLVSAGGTDMYTQKITASGGITWLNATGGIGDEYGAGVYVDLSGKVYATGHTHETEMYNPNPEYKTATTTSAENVFVEEISTLGSLISSTNLESDLLITLNSFISDNYGNFFLIGKYKGTVDFDPGEDHQYLTTNGAGSMYVLKLGQSVTNINENIFANDIIIYPNPATNNLSISFGNTYKNISLGIYDAIGNLVYSEENKESKQINLSLNQAPGIYFVNIQSDDKRIIKRLIVE